MIQLKDDYNNRGCLVGSYSLNCWAKYKISQRSIKLLKEIKNLKTEHDAFKEKIETQPLRAVREIPTSSIVVGKIIKLNLEKVLGYLADDNVSMMGIWGMGGVGKTTLLNEINNSLQGGDANMGFNHVIYLVVSKEPLFEKLQKEISERLGLPSHSDKNDIFEFLKNKNFLLLLDDIWEKVELPEKLGIPLPHHQSQNREDRSPRCNHKVIFTTRKDDVCAGMKADKKIKVECLDGEEAWNLFKQHANEETINSNASIKKLSMKVMEKCSGLPLALKVIGRATSNMNTPEEWRHMLRSLIKMDVRTVTSIEVSLFHNLKASYDNLADDTLRQCFLCCAQWREDVHIPISDLIEQWIGCELISDFENIEEAFDEGYSLIAKLKEACLLKLEFGVVLFDEDFVKLHDVIRNMALWIVSECGKKKNKWIVGGSDDDIIQFLKWEAGNWQEIELISFKGILPNNSLLKFLSDQNIDEKGQLSVAATSPRYPNLQSLFMNCYYLCDPLPEVVINFFPHMPSLTHLNLSGAPIAGLSKEIRVLVNLRYLNISMTKILSLPSELKELKELKCFIFRSKGSRGGFLPKVDGLATISMLPKLQVLDLFQNTCLEASDLSLLVDRNRIKVISLVVDSVEILGLLKHLPTWKIRLHRMQNMHTLHLCDLSYKHGEGLMELHINHCSFEELLINGSVVNLKHFYLFGLEKLKQISCPVETVPSECFQRFTVVNIHFCESLRSLSWVLHLPCLRELEVCHCSAIEELIDPPEMQQALSGLPTFPSLQSLTIFDLANLVSISTCLLDFPVLSSLKLVNCPKLKKLPFKSSIVNNKFRLVDVDKECWEHLEWEDTTIRSHLANSLKLYDSRQCCSIL
ncbi:P-loop containing nucleoside triphosphate hydrolase protein [Dioscorea alata]|uniref:P-loop containing nucleoside triphosphate hydrolase protein n=1 Tax=Dioscorea alata TaxID=55571 RepID=A0ACB7UYF0_DIOAL|nr:P-loop containing nucleoside triphosphate hydrolase protein [Dioscorea alata]